MPNKNVKAINLDDYKNKMHVVVENVDFEPSQTQFVLQHEYALTYAKSATPILGTVGAGSCFILAIYDAKKKVSLLAHLDATSDIHAFEKIFKEFSNQLEAHLYGGEDDELFAAEIINFLQNHNVQIKNSDILMNSDSSSGALAIDSRTGFIYTNVQASHLNFDKRTQENYAKADFLRNERLARGKERCNDFMLKNMHLNSADMTIMFASLFREPVVESFNDVPKNFKQKIVNKFFGVFHKESKSKHKSESSSTADVNKNSQKY